MTNSSQPLQLFLYGSKGFPSTLVDSIQFWWSSWPSISRPIFSRRLTDAPEFSFHSQNNHICSPVTHSFIYDFDLRVARNYDNSDHIFSNCQYGHEGLAFPSPWNLLYSISTDQPECLAFILITTSWHYPGQRKSFVVRSFHDSHAICSSGRLDFTESYHDTHKEPTRRFLLPSVSSES